MREGAVKQYNSKILDGTEGLGTQHQPELFMPQNVFFF